MEMFYDRTKKWCILLNMTDMNNKIRHIRGIIDEEFIVYRVWSRYKRSWEYRIDWYYGFLLAYQDGDLKPYKK